MQRAKKNALGKYRKRHDVQQKYMAAFLGKNKYYVCRVEKGILQPSLETVLTYSLMFGVEVKELVPEMYQELQKSLAIGIDEHAVFFTDKRSYQMVSSRLKNSLTQKEYEL